LNSAEKEGTGPSRSFFCLFCCSHRDQQIQQKYEDMLTLLAKWRETMTNQSDGSIQVRGVDGWGIVGVASNGGRGVDGMGEA